MPEKDAPIFYRRNLPHYQPPAAKLFITFRLAGSLPQGVIQQMRREAAEISKNLSFITDQEQNNEFHYKTQKLMFARYDKALDSNPNGPHWLADPIIARIVCDRLHALDNKYYLLDAYCVMPNHVHLLISQFDDTYRIYPLYQIMQLIKGYSAYQANRILNRSGIFWQHESYDHVVRDNAEYLRIIAYILENPVRAGLPSRWIYCREDI